MLSIPNTERAAPEAGTLPERRSSSIRLGLALLRWGHRRVGSSATSREDERLRYATVRQRELRERAWHQEHTLGHSYLHGF